MPIPLLGDDGNILASCKVLLFENPFVVRLSKPAGKLVTISNYDSALPPISEKRFDPLLQPFPKSLLQPLPNSQTHQSTGYNDKNSSEIVDLTTDSDIDESVRISDTVYLTSSANKEQTRSSFKRKELESRSPQLRAQPKRSKDNVYTDDSSDDSTM